MLDNSDKFRLRKATLISDHWVTHHLLYRVYQQSGSQSDFSALESLYISQILSSQKDEQECLCHHSKSESAGTYYICCMLNTPLHQFTPAAETDHRAVKISQSAASYSEAHSETQSAQQIFWAISQEVKKDYSIWALQEDQL